MPWETDYIELCNMTSPEFKEWLGSTYKKMSENRGKWVRPSVDVIDNAYKSLRSFREIVVKWAEDEGLPEEDKHKVIRNYLGPKSGGTKIVPLNSWFRWKGDTLEEVEFIEILDENSFSLLTFHLYRELFEDVDNSREGRPLKPRLCRLRAATGTQEIACGKLFRPERKNHFYCSTGCKSTAGTRRTNEKKNREIYARLR